MLENLFRIKYEKNCCFLQKMSGRLLKVSRSKLRNSTLQAEGGGLLQHSAVWQLLADNLHIPALWQRGTHNNTFIVISLLIGKLYRMESLPAPSPRWPAPRGMNTSLLWVAAPLWHFTYLNSLFSKRQQSPRPYWRREKVQIQGDKT